MYSTKINPKFNINQNPKIGLIALASDYMIEKDFISVIKDKKIDFFVNRIECFNPLTRKSYKNVRKSHRCYKRYFTR